MSVLTLVPLPVGPYHRDNSELKKTERAIAHFFTQAFESTPLDIQGDVRGLRTQFQKILIAAPLSQTSIKNLQKIRYVAKILNDPTNELSFSQKTEILCAQMGTILGAKDNPSLQRAIGTFQTMYSEMESDRLAFEKERAVRELKDFGAFLFQNTRDQKERESQVSAFVEDVATMLERSQTDRHGWQQLYSFLLNNNNWNSSHSSHSSHPSFYTKDPLSLERNVQNFSKKLKDILPEKDAWRAGILQNKVFLNIEKGRASNIRHLPERIPGKRRRRSLLSRLTRQMMAAVLAVFTTIPAVTGNADTSPGGNPPSTPSPAAATQQQPVVVQPPATTPITPITKNDPQADKNDPQAELTRARHIIRDLGRTGGDTSTQFQNAAKVYVKNPSNTGTASYVQLADAPLEPNSIQWKTCPSHKPCGAVISPNSKKLPGIQVAYHFINK